MADKQEVNISDYEAQSMENKTTTYLSRHASQGKKFKYHKREKERI